MGTVSAGTDTEQKSLKIYLPRQVQIDNDHVQLGDVAVIRGEPSYVQQINRINLGVLSNISQELVISRAMILGRLNACGFGGSQVEMTGADKVVVGKRSETIRAVKFKETAETFLRQNLNDSRVCQLELVGTVSDVVLPGKVKTVELIPALVKSNSKNKAKVSISVIIDGRQLTRREVEFRLMYFCRETVAMRDIAGGEMISRDNVKISQKMSYRSERNWQVPYGMVARRTIKEGGVITSSEVEPLRKEVLVKRNKNVAVVVNRPGLSLSAVGKALEDGSAGDTIRVRMQITNTTRIIYAKVNTNGTVEPIL